VFHPDQITSSEVVGLIEPTRTRACLVPGCPCKDARIVSHRRAAFFAVIARRNGETADRSISPDPEWRLPSAADPVGASII
jgi:hypothetical protein